MAYKWETEKERIKRLAAIAPEKKLEWLEQMRRFSLHLPKKVLAIQKRLRRS